MKRILLALWVGAGLGWAASCGPLDDLDLDNNPAPGEVCYVDSDCAPNGCCGKGTDVVHVSQAPSCDGVSCDGSCPAGGINCGCGVPACRNQRCTAAITVTENCP